MTHGLQFNLVPGTHVGVRATYPVADSLELVLGLNNGADKNVDDNHGKTIEGMATYTISEAWVTSIQFNYGAETASNEREKNLTLNAWSSYDLSEETSGYIEFTYGSKENVTNTVDQNVWGIGVSAIHWLTDQYGLSSRFEYVDDPDRGITDLAAKYSWNFTITGHCKVTDDIMLRLEYRHDGINQNGFNGDRGADTEDDQSIVGVQLVYSF
jgi:hypothetical protein